MEGCRGEDRDQGGGKREYRNGNRISRAYGDIGGGHLTHGGKETGELGKGRVRPVRYARAGPLRSERRMSKEDLVKRGAACEWYCKKQKSGPVLEVGQ